MPKTEVFNNLRGILRVATGVDNPATRTATRKGSIKTRKPKAGKINAANIPLISRTVKFDQEVLIITSAVPAIIAGNR